MAAGFLYPRNPTSYPHEYLCGISPPRASCLSTHLPCTRGLGIVGPAAYLSPRVPNEGGSDLPAPDRAHFIPIIRPSFLPCFRVACFAKLRGSHERSHQRRREREKEGRKEKLQFSRRSLFQFGPFNVSLKRSSFFFNVQPRYSLTEGVKTRVEGEVQR